MNEPVNHGIIVNGVPKNSGSVETVSSAEGVTHCPVIEVKHLRKVYKMGEVEVMALQDVSFNIECGEVVSRGCPGGQLPPPPY